MDFAADAVFEHIAPPSRTAPARAQAAEPADRPSFDDHLQAAAQSENGATEVAAEPTQAREQDWHADEPTGSAASTESKPKGERAQNTDAASAAPTLSAQNPAAPPLLLQVISTSPPSQQTAPAGVADTSDAPPAVGAAAPASTPAGGSASPPATGATPDSPAPAEGGTTPTKAPHSQKSAPASNEKSASANTPAPAAAQPASVAPQGAAPPAPTETAGATSAAPPEIAGGAAAAFAASRPPAAPEHAAAQQKSAPRGEGKSAEPRDAAPVNTTLVAQASRPQAKAAPPSSGAKEPVAPAALDAPDSAPSQQAPPAPASSAPAHAQQVSMDQSAARAAPAAHQVAREIVRRFDGGATRFELRLDPPELGRVEVRLEVSRDHRVTAVIAADSAQALTELARHARELEQMLHAAGLELSDNGLSFDLRQGGERAEAADFDHGSRLDAAAPLEDATPAPARPLGYERWRGVRVDMMV